MVRRLWTILPTVIISRLAISVFWDSLRCTGWQVICNRHTLPTDTGHIYLLYLDLNHEVTVGQVLKCQWWLRGCLVCTICYTCQWVSDVYHLLHVPVGVWCVPSAARASGCLVCTICYTCHICIEIKAIPVTIMYVTLLFQLPHTWFYTK
jgi:hypothetical protein